MELYLLVKTLHVISSAILFGTGIGIAFFMYQSRKAANLSEKHFAIRNTVLADYLFTLPAVIIQPLTGIYLVLKVGYSWTDFWLVSTMILYLVIGLCWVPVVWIQIQLKKMILFSMENNTEIPSRYYQLTNIWFYLGWPAFISLLLIFYLMISKPV